jgi:hypothetical protein
MNIEIDRCVTIDTRRTLRVGLVFIKLSSGFIAKEIFL